MIKTLNDLDYHNKRVLMRVDFNVPLDDKGNVRDGTRISAVKPTIDEVLGNGASIVMMSHLGGRKLKAMDTSASHTFPNVRSSLFSLAPVAEWIRNHWHIPIKFAPDCVGDEVKLIAQNLQPGEILLLENLRLHPGEEDNDVDFAAQLAQLGDVYVNDAFSVSHRPHASVKAVVNFFKGKAVAGRLLEKELRYFSDAIENPDRPLIAILGGVKVSTKITLIKNLLNKVDHLLIGGAISYAFTHINGGDIGDSFLEEDTLDEARKIMESPLAYKMVLPVDSANVTSLDSTDIHYSPSNKIPNGWKGIDIGNETIEAYTDIIMNARTVIWNGPMGMFEKPAFAKGTYSIADAMAKAREKGIVTIAGGGDSAAALTQFGLKDKMTYVSTGGGASMELLEGKILPGVAALNDI